VNHMQHDFVGSPVAQDYTTLIGTPFKVLLSGGVVVKFNSVTRKETTEIIDLPGLIAAIVKSRVLHPRKLSGDDLKYIRSALSLKSSEVANTLDLTPEHYCRCENGTKSLSSSAEKFYRMFAYLEASSRDKDFNEMSKEEQIKDCDPEKAKKAIEAFRKLFLEMKIQHIYPAEEELTLVFFRRDCQPECEDCKDEEIEWQEEVERDAA
jgi:DNA-binding transcriptional regulator YiaG